MSLTSKDIEIGDILELNAGKVETRNKLVCEVTNISPHDTFDALILEVNYGLSKTHPAGKIHQCMSTNLFSKTTAVNTRKYEKLEKILFDSIRKLQFKLDKREKQAWAKKQRLK